MQTQLRQAVVVAFERVDNLPFVVLAECLDRDAQLDGGVAVGADELVVLEFDDVAVLTRDDARHA